MRIPLTLCLALGLALLVVLTGCDGVDGITGRELDDESYAEFVLEMWQARSREEEDAIQQRYGWSDEELDGYETALFQDYERAVVVVELVRARDVGAAAMLELEMGLASEWSDDELNQTCPE